MTSDRALLLFMLAIGLVAGLLIYRNRNDDLRRIRRWKRDRLVVEKPNRRRK